MPPVAVDYSFARFSAAQLEAKGVAAVGRYLTPTGGAGRNAKAITESELDALVAGGEVVFFFFEWDENDATGGFAKGIRAATNANAALAAIGLPASQPVLFSDDSEREDPQTALPYWQGIASVRPVSSNGAYAEGAVIEALRAAGLIAYACESAAKSFPGNASTVPGAELQQEATGSPLPSTDLDEILAADFGQYPRPAGPAPVEVNMSDFPNAVAVANTVTGGGAWVAGSDGGVFTVGSAQYHGSIDQLDPAKPAGGVNATTLSAPIVAIVRTRSGGGYWLVGRDGGVFPFGDAYEAQLATGAFSYPGLPAADREGDRTFGAGSLEEHASGKGYTLTALDGDRYVFGA